jgi:hypothetical protein
MRYHEIITEIISTKLSPSLSYDAKNHRLKVEKQSGLFVDKEAGELITFERPAPALTLKHLNRINKIRRKFLKQERETLKLRQSMYGNVDAVDREQNELADMKRELKLLKKEIGNSIKSASLSRKRKATLNAKALRHLST